MDTPKAIIIAAAILALGIYAGGEHRFEIVPTGTGAGAYILDKSSGAVTLCAATTCYQAKAEQN